MKHPLELQTILLGVLLAGCSVHSADDKSALDNLKDFSCEPPNRVSYDPWGPQGLSKGCITPSGDRIGSFITAEQGRVVMRGNYEDGRKSGVWEWLDAAGNVEKVERYRIDENDRRR